MILGAVKEKLHEYIEHADEKKIQAIYTLVEEDIENRAGLYDEAALQIFRNTRDGFFFGKIEGFKMEESLHRIREKIKQK